MTDTLDTATEPRAIRLTNMEAAARVVAKLAVAGFIGPRQLVGACRAVCVPAHLVNTAITEISRNGYRAPSTILAPVVVIPPPEQPADRPIPAATEAAARRPAQFPDGTRTKRCARCQVAKPIAEYRYVNKGRRRPQGNRTFAFQSWCRDCWVTYQQERYISAAREAALASVGLDLAGPDIVCVICGQPITNRKTGTTIPIACHTTCLEENA